jgi:hypothetical protein
MRKKILFGLAAACVFLLLGLRAPSAQRLATSQTCTPPSQCCKICSKGKACGDTCIRADYTCHKGRGCACNVEEVCRN